MECPNCAGRPEKAAHGDGCVLGALVHVLEDRGHDLAEVDLEKVDADFFWTSFGGPAADWVAQELGIPAYPADDRESVAGDDGVRR